MNMLIDAHAHLTASSESVQTVLMPLLERAKKSGVRAIINVCCDAEDLKRGLALANNTLANSTFANSTFANSSEIPKVYTIAALTPHDANKEDALFFSLIEENARLGVLVAIGETGLDYFYMHAPKEQQQEMLKKHFRLAHRFQLPLVIHCREAFLDLFWILDDESQKSGFFPKVMIHCFTGTKEEADAILKRGWYLSLSGCVTYPKNRGLQEIAALFPLEQLLIETDSPYLAPQSYRGKKNEPAYLVETARCIALYKKISFEELAAATASNAQEFFQI